MNKIRKERREITVDATEIQKVREYYEHEHPYTNNLDNPEKGTNS